MRLRVALSWAAVAALAVLLAIPAFADDRKDELKDRQERHEALRQTTQWSWPYGKVEVPPAYRPPAGRYYGPAMRA